MYPQHIVLFRGASNEYTQRMLLWKNDKTYQYFFFAETLLKGIRNICFFLCRGASNEYPQYIFLWRNERGASNKYT